MLGLNDRVAIREPAAEKSDNEETTRRTPSAKPDAKPADATKPDGEAGAKPDDKAVDTELSPDDAADNDAPPVDRAGKERALAERPL